MIAVVFEVTPSPGSHESTTYSVQLFAKWATMMAQSGPLLSSVRQGGRVAAVPVAAAWVSMN